MHLSYSPYVPHGPLWNSSWCYHLKNIWWGIQVIKLLFMRSSPLYCHLPLRPKCVPQNPIIEKPQLKSSPPPFIRPSLKFTKKTGKITVLYISRYLVNKLRDKIFCTEWQQAFPDFNLLSLSSWMEFLCVRIVPPYFNFSTLSNELFSFYCDFVLHSNLETSCTSLYQHFLLVKFPY
jgi:hypothetical protein